MDQEEKKEKLEFIQKFFVKSFWISLFLLILSSLICVVMHDYQVEFANKYFMVDEEAYGFLVVLLLGMWKIMIVQFTLIPAITIWGIRKCCKCGSNKDI